MRDRRLPVTHPWLRDLPADMGALMTAAATSKHLRDGETLFARGEASDGLFAVLRGRIRISSVTPEGREVMFDLIEPGNCFGEASVFDDKPHRQDARAVGDTDLLVLPRERLQGMLRQYPQIYDAFAKLLCGRLRATVEYFEDALVLPLAGRVAKRLLHLVDTYGVPKGDGILIDLHLPQDDIARMMAASRQSVSKELKAWEAKGLIKLDYGRVTLLKPDEMRAILNELEGARSTPAPLPALQADLPPRGGG